jgi:hypothetical protein
MMILPIPRISSGPPRPASTLTLRAAEATQGQTNPDLHRLAAAEKL